MAIRILYESANPGAILIDNGDGIPRPYGQGQLSPVWDSAGVTFGIKHSHLDTAHLVPPQGYAAFNCYIDGALQTIGSYTALETFIKTYLYVAPSGSSGGFASVGGSTAVVQVAPVVTVAAYSVGYVLGGVQTITNAMRISNGTGTLASLLVIDQGNKKPAIDILIFSQPPTGTYTDKTAFLLTVYDTTYLLRKISIATTDWETFVSGSSANNSAIVDVASIGKAIKATGGNANLYCIIVAQTAFTPVGSTDFILNVGTYRD